MIFGINYNLSSKLRLKNAVYWSLNQNNEPQSMHPEENGAVKNSEDRWRLWTAKINAVVEDHFAKQSSE